MKISDKNIRATALSEFWCEEYPEALYLWQGAQHNCTLTDIEKSTIPTHKDLFSTQEEIQKAHEFCKSFYYRMLPELASRLNRVHNLDLPVRFWQRAFGYWLYRHISVVYDKYAYLNLLDIDATGIKLLSKNDFYIPQNHSDYIYCFAGDFGVQQLVSQYYYLFKTKDFVVVNRTFIHGDASSNNNAMSNWLRRKLSLLIVEPQVALLGISFGEKTRNLLHEKSHGKISSFILPVTGKNALEADFAKRHCIAKGVIESSFESYFIQSLYYCLPKDFLENFAEYYNVFQKDLESRKFTHIVAEFWISSIPDAIYVALAKEKKRIFISHEHGASNCYYINSMQFIDYDVADMFISVGWRGKNENIIQGGFTCRDVIPYKQDPEKKTILYINTTKFIYWEEFNERGATDTTFIKELKLVANIIDLFPSALKENLLFRPRPENIYLWDVEHLLDLKKHNVNIDRGDFAESISQSRIVILDHMSTGFAEILLMNVPFILVCDINFIPLPSDMKRIFDDLIDCGVIHSSAQSAVSHLSSVYDDVEGWWQNEFVRRPVNQLKDISLAPASKTTKYLLSLLEDVVIRRHTLISRFWILSLGSLMIVFRVKNKILSLITPVVKKMVNKKIFRNLS